MKGEERFEQALVLVQLLGHLASYEEGSGDEHAAAYGGALLSCMGDVVPRLTASLLQYTALCEAYFAMLASLLESRPSAALALPPPLDAATLSSIEFGLAHHQSSICRAALECSYELARQVWPLRSSPTPAGPCSAWDGARVCVVVASP